MTKKIFILLVLVLNILYADTVDDFNKVIDETHFYDPKEKDNSVVEAVIPYYLKAENLFSKERMTEWYKMEIKEKVYNNRIPKQRIYEYNIVILKIKKYLLSLQNSSTKESKKLLLQLSQKMLFDLTQEMKHSQGAKDYGFSYNTLIKLYEELDDKSLIVNYPPLSQEVFIERIKLHGKSFSDLIKEKTYMLLLKENRLESLKVYKEQNRLISEHLEKHYEKIAKVIKNPTPKNIEIFKLYREDININMKSFAKELMTMKESSFDESLALDLLKKINVEKEFYIRILAIPKIDKLLESDRKRKELVKKYNLMTEKFSSPIVKNEEKLSFLFYFYYGIIGLFLLYLLWVISDFIKGLVGHKSEK